jgi:lysozyme
MNLDLAVALCKQFEGLHRLGKDGLIYPYICPAGYPTIGWGTVYKPDGSKVTMEHPPITRETADAWLIEDLRKVYASAVMRQCPELFAWSLTNGNWRAFCAIADFTYNLGTGRLQTSTLRRKLRALDWDGAREQLALWVRGGGRVLPGLVRRRQAEAALLEV